MTEPSDPLAELRQEEYRLRLEADRLRREVFGQDDPSADPARMEALEAVEAQLQGVEEQRSALQAQDPASGRILESASLSAGEVTRGLETTGLQAQIYLNMAHVPTAFYHLLDRESHPLFTCQVTTGRGLRRVRLTSFIDGYSAQAVDTRELPANTTQTIKQLPTLFPERLQALTELTRATLNIQVEDLDRKTELHATEPIWLLARTSAPLSVMDPQTGRWQDLSRYLGAFVTPNAPGLLRFLRSAARLHPEGRLAGYQGPEEGVTPQVGALFAALKEAGLTYVNSVIDFNPQQGASSQRVRLPRECLEAGEANCLDGAVLYASLLEGLSLSPALALVPGHALVAWESWQGSGEWRYLETTLTGSGTFEQACTSGQRTASLYGGRGRLNVLSLRELRTKYAVTPME